MNLATVYTLNYGNEGKTIQEGDKIKVYLENGEILIGEYQYSDCLSLTIDRNNEDIDIDFEEIKDINKLN